jgi:hypothetical protein
MEKHITLLGVLHIVYHALGLLIGVLIVSLLGWIVHFVGEPEVSSILGMVMSIIAFFMIVISVPGIIAGIGLVKRRPWSRILALVIGIIDLLDIPLGTALGVYTIWVLMSDESVPLFPSQPQVQASS